MLESDERPPRLGGARPVLRGLADLPRGARRRRPARSTRPPRASGTAPASGAAATSARRWELSSEGLAYGDDGLKLSKISGPDARRTGACSPAPRRPASSRAATAAPTWSLLSTLDGQPGRDDWNDPGNQPPGHLGMPAILAAPGRPVALLGRRPGLRHLRDDGRRRARWTPRNRGPARRLAARGPGGRLLRPQARDVARPTSTASTSRTTVGMHRSDDGGRIVDEITEGLPTEFGFAAAVAPARPRHLLRDPARPRPRPLHARRAGGRLAHAATPARRWQRLDDGLPQRDAHLGVLREGMAIDALDVPGLYFGTSTGQVFASADEGESWSEIASYLPAIASVEVGGGGVADGRPAPARRRCRRCSRACRGASTSTRATVDEAIDRLDERWPGLRDRLCEPGPGAAPPHQRLRRPRARRARHAARRAARGST